MPRRCDGPHACCACDTELTVPQLLPSVGDSLQLPLPSILAIFDCWSEHYEPAVTCSGYQDLLPSQHMPHASPAETKPFLSHSELQHAVQSAHNISAGGSVPDVYTCYNDSSTKEFPLERMWSYLDNVTLAGPPSDGRLYTAQGIWQESATTVIIGEAEGSTLLLDETRSGLNALLTARIKGQA